MSQKVTILIPHYKTLELTQLCLSRLKAHTDLDQARVIVIDNGSNDESTDYLRSLDWIDLIIREDTSQEGGAEAHAKALDLALERVDTPFLLSIHTDTFFLRDDWLDFLFSHFDSSDVGGVGSWKLEDKPWYRRKAKQLERWWQLKVWYPLLGKGEGAIEGVGRNYYYLRSHCAMYRMEAIQAVQGRFFAGREPAGKVLHRKLESAGYRMVFLPSEQLSRYLVHLNHATTILQSRKEGQGAKHARQRKRILKMLKEKGGVHK